MDHSKSVSEILDISAWFLNGIHSFFPNFDLRNHLKKHELEEVRRQRILERRHLFCVLSIRCLPYIFSG